MQRYKDTKITVCDKNSIPFITLNKNKNKYVRKSVKCAFSLILLKIPKSGLNLEKVDLKYGETVLAKNASNSPG